jgi:hypothetical protein
MTLPLEIAAKAEEIVNSLTQTDYQHKDNIGPATGGRRGRRNRRHVRCSIQKRRVRLQFFIFDPHGYCWLRGVRLCNTIGGVGVAGESKDGIGSRGHSAENNGVVGLSDSKHKSGVFGFNTKQQGAGYGVFGRCDASNGAGLKRNPVTASGSGDIAD